MFENSNKVLKLVSSDFTYTGGEVRAKNPVLLGKDVIIMIFAGWCPHCMAKEEMWTYLSELYNSKSIKDNLRIAVVDTEDVNTAELTTALKVGPIPRFVFCGKDGLVHDFDSELIYDILKVYNSTA